jgi:hypothetical protein
MRSCIEALLDLAQQIVHLGGRRATTMIGSTRPVGPHHLLHHLALVLLLVGRRRGRHEHRLGQQALELLELERPVVQRRRQAEAVLDQVLLARAVALVHRPHLADRHVGFVDEHQAVLGQVVDQGRRRIAGLRPDMWRE